MKNLPSSPTGTIDKALERTVEELVDEMDQLFNLREKYKNLLSDCAKRNFPRSRHESIRGLLPLIQKLLDDGVAKRSRDFALLMKEFEREMKELQEMLESSEPLTTTMSSHLKKIRAYQKISDIISRLHTFEYMEEQQPAENAKDSIPDLLPLSDSLNNFAIHLLYIEQGFLYVKHMIQDLMRDTTSIEYSTQKKDITGYPVVALIVEMQRWLYSNLGRLHSRLDEGAVSSEEAKWLIKLSRTLERFLERRLQLLLLFEDGIGMHGCNRSFKLPLDNGEYCYPHPSMVLDTKETAENACDSFWVFVRKYAYAQGYLT